MSAIGRLRVVFWSCLVGGFDLGQFLFPCQALAVPGLVFSAAGGAFPGYLVIVLRGTLSG